jgi:hypothetical protein
MFLPWTERYRGDAEYKSGTAQNYLIGQQKSGRF